MFPPYLPNVLQGASKTIEFTWICHSKLTLNKIKSLGPLTGYNHHKTCFCTRKGKGGKTVVTGNEVIRTTQPVNLSCCCTALMTWGEPVAFFFSGLEETSERFLEGVKLWRVSRWGWAGFEQCTLSNLVLSQPTSWCTRLSHCSESNLMANE